MRRSSSLYGFDGTLLRLTATECVRAGVDVPDIVSSPGKVSPVKPCAPARSPSCAICPRRSCRFARRCCPGTPRHVVVSPLLADLVMQGVVEAGFVHAPSPRALALLERTRDTIAVALRAAFYRDRLRELLEETQRQSRGAAGAAGRAARRQRGAGAAVGHPEVVAGPSRAAAGGARGDATRSSRRRRRSSSGSRTRCRTPSRRRSAPANTSPSSSPTCRTSCARRSTAP